MWRKGERGQKKNEQMEGDFREMGKVMEWELRERGWKELKPLPGGVEGPKPDPGQL